MTTKTDAAKCAEDQLLPCPFCGYPPAYKEYPQEVKYNCIIEKNTGPRFVIRCERAGCINPSAHHYSYDLVLDIWNTRTHFPPSVPVSLLTRRHAEYSMEIAKYAQQNDQTGVDICVGKRNAIDRLITEARSHE